LHSTQPISKRMPMCSARMPNFRCLSPKQGQKRLGKSPANRRRRPEFPHDFRRNSPSYLGKGAPVSHQGGNGMTLDINKSWADEHPLRIQSLGTLYRVRTLRHDINNLVTGNKNIAVLPRISCSVDDAASGNDMINLHLPHV